MSANSVPELPQTETQQIAGASGPQNQSGFRPIPQRGAAPGNGEQPQREQSHQYPGQRPGYVDEHNPQQGQKPAQGQQQQAQPAQNQSQGLDIAAILQAALGAKEAAQTLPKSLDEKPAWLQGSVNEFNVDSIDDPIIKSMASVLKVAGDGLDLDRVLGNALALGDPNLVDVAYIAEKGGKNAQQIAEIAKGIVQAVNAKSDAITQEIHTLAGGEAQWSQSAAVFNKVAPDALRAVVKTMLDSTDANKIKAGAKIVTEFGRASGQLPKQGASLLNGASAAAAGANGLSAQAFKAELNKLDSNKPGFLEAREDLFARRAAGKRLGL